MNGGKIERERDLKPIVEDMKQKWKGKVQVLQGEGERVGVELV